MNVKKYNEFSKLIGASIPRLKLRLQSTDTDTPSYRYDVVDYPSCTVTFKRAESLDTYGNVLGILKVSQCDVTISIIITETSSFCRAIDFIVEHLPTKQKCYCPYCGTLLNKKDGAICTHMMQQS